MVVSFKNSQCIFAPRHTNMIKSKGALHLMQWFKVIKARQVHNGEYRWSNWYFGTRVLTPSILSVVVTRQHVGDLLAVGWVEGPWALVMPVKDIWVGGKNRKSLNLLKACKNTWQICPGFSQDALRIRIWITQ